MKINLDLFKHKHEINLTSNKKFQHPTQTNRIPYEQDKQNCIDHHNNNNQKAPYKFPIRRLLNTKRSA